MSTPRSAPPLTTVTKRVHPVDEVLPLPKLATYGFQHVVAFYAGAVLVPIIIAGAPLAGLARSIKHKLPVPAVDGVSSAVNHAQSLASLAPTPARAGSFARPPIKDNQGLSPALSELLARKR